MNKDILILKEKLNNNLNILHKNIVLIIFNDFDSVFEKTVKNNKDKKMLLSEFQDNIVLLVNNKKFIENYSKKHLNLILIIFQLYINIYNKLNKKYNYVSLPETTDYIIELYKIFGRLIWSNPKLYNSFKKTNDINFKNKIIKLIKTSIEESFSSLLSYESYSDDESDKYSEKSYEEEEENIHNDLKIIKNDLEEEIINENDIDESILNQEEGNYYIENLEVNQEEEIINENYIDKSLLNQEEEKDVIINNEQVIHEDNKIIEIKENLYDQVNKTNDEMLIEISKKNNLMYPVLKKKTADVIKKPKKEISEKEKFKRLDKILTEKKKLFMQKKRL